MRTRENVKEMRESERNGKRETSRMRDDGKEIRKKKLKLSGNRPPFSI